jgi:type II secretory pathway pseudopilin PulG
MSLDDRLSFGDSSSDSLPPEPEEAPRGRPNRAFIIIAIAMGGLIVLGALALVLALRFWVPNQRAQQMAYVTQTIEAMTQEAASWTPTYTPPPTSALPTWTPTLPATATLEPTPTATRVVQGGEDTPTRTPTPTRPTSAEWGATTPGTTPATGLGSFGMAAIAVGLAGLVFAVRKLRSG